MKTSVPQWRWAVPAVATGMGAALLAGYVFGGETPPSGQDDTLAAARGADPTPTPTAVTRKEGDRRVVVSGARDTRLLALDLRGRKATLKASGASAALRPGDVVASAPSRVAPHGALFTVDRVVRRSKGGATVTIRSATVADALGDAEVSRRSAVSPGNIKVKPLVGGVRHRLSASPGGSSGLRPGTRPGTPGPEAPATGRSSAGSPEPGAPAPQAPATTPHAAAPTPSAIRSMSVGDDDLSSQIPRDARVPLTTLRLAVDLPLPDEVKATGHAAPKASAWVEFTPELILQYRTDGGLQPTEAALGVGGRYSHGYELHGTLSGSYDTGRRLVKIPFAEVDLENTFWVGGVPLPVEAHLRYFYRLSADGRISIDAEHRTDGQLTFAGHYVKDKGWSLVREAKSRATGTPLEVTGSGAATATIGITGDVMLFGVVGAGAEFAPYVRGTATVGTSPAWALYAGLDLNSWLSARLKLFGIELWSQEWRLPPVHGEWRLAGDAER